MCEDSEGGFWTHQVPSRYRRFVIGCLPRDDWLQINDFLKRFGLRRGSSTLASCASLSAAAQRLRVHPTDRVHVILTRVYVPFNQGHRPARRWCLVRRGWRSF